MLGIMAASPGEASRAALAARVRDPGYTPGVRDMAQLLELFGDDDEDVARATERAVLRIEARYVARVMKETIARATLATRPARGRLARLVGRLASATGTTESVATEARAWLVGALADADPKTR